MRYINLNDLSSILSQITRLSDRQTDGRTDRILVARRTNIRALVLVSTTNVVDTEIYIHLYTATRLGIREGKTVLSQPATENKTFTSEKRCTLHRVTKAERSYIVNRR